MINDRPQTTRDMIYAYELVQSLDQTNPETSILKAISTIILLSILLYPFDHQRTQVSQTLQQPSSSSFTLVPEPAYPSVTQGSSAVSNITVSSVNGFSGTVTFSQPLTQHWITATLNISSVPISPSNPGVVALKLTVVGPVPFDAPDCPWIACPANVTVTGTAGTYSQTAIVEVFAYGPNFEFYSSQTVPIVQGRSGSANLTLHGMFYAGPVSLTATVAPGGPKVTINPDKLELDSTSWQHPMVTIDTAGLKVGDYNVDITATEMEGPFVYHQVRFDVFVWTLPQAPPEPSILSWFLANVFVILGPIFFAGFLTVTALLDRRARKQNGKPASSDEGQRNSSMSQD